MSQTEKSMENTIRRTLDRAGYILHKGVCCADQSGYLIAEAATNTVVAGNDNGLEFTMSLEDVQEWIEKNL